MGKNELVALAKELKLIDERELLAKVVISYSTAAKVANVAFGRTQGAGNDGFLGVYKDQLVCYESNLLGTKPVRERFRFSFEFVKEHEIKTGLMGLNNQYNIATDQHRFKLYFMKKRLPLIEAIDQAIK